MTQQFIVGGTDYTDVLDKTSPEIGGKAAYGERSVGEATLYDETNVIDDDNAIRVWKQFSWVETATSPDTTLAAGRVTGWATQRDDERGVVRSNGVTWTLQLEDANAELQKLACAPSIGPCDAKGQYVRPAETDVERVQAVLADWLNGDPRASTVIDGSTYVPDANTVDMDAKTYPPGTTPADILMECATAADKEFFVDQDYNLHYDIPTTELYDAPIEISDGVGSHPDPDFVTYWPPIWDMGPALDYQGQEFASALVGVYAGNKAVYEEDASNIADFDYLAEVVNLDAETEGQATHDVHGLLRIRGRGMRSYQLTLRLKNTQVDKIKYGQRVRLHVSAAVDMDDTPQYRRIAELKWQPVGDGEWYDAHITLERMPRLFPGNINGGPIIPKPPDTGTPGTPPTAPTEDYRWSFTDRGGAAELNVYEDGGTSYPWQQMSWENNVSPSAWHDDYGSAHITWSATGANISAYLPITAGETYTISADMSQRQADSAVYLRAHWYSATPGTLVQTDYIAGPGVSVAAKSNYSKVIVAPVGANFLRLFVDASVGEFGAMDNVVISHGGSGGTAGTPSSAPPTTVGGTGSGTYSGSGQYVPVGSILEHSYITEGGPYHDADQIAVDAITGALAAASNVQLALEIISAFLDTLSAAGYLTATGGEKHTVNTVSSSGSSLTLDLADGNVHDVTLDDDCTLAFDGATNGAACYLHLHLIQDGSGNRAVTWPASVIWPNNTAPTISTTAGHSDWFDFVTVDGGANWYGDAGGSSGASAMDDLTDVTITSAATDQTLIYNGSVWVNTSLIWRPLMDGAGAVITDGATGEAIMALS